jgi:hypothetical protein
MADEQKQKKRGGLALKILGVFVALLGVLAIVVATRPAEFHIERSVVVAAPAAVPFAQVNDFHSWPAWSPYEKLDPAMKKTYEGAPSGVGATYAWAGNDQVGEGKMTILTSEAPRKLTVRLEFTKPFAATNTATFTFTPEGSGTKVTWAMDGRNGFLAKGAGMVMDMDKLVGGDFEKGLAALKAVSEAPKP